MWAYASRLKQCTHTATRGKGASDLSKSARRQSRRIAHQGRAGLRTGDMGGGGGYTYDFGRLFESDPVGGSKHEATVFMLHGLGDTGDGWSFAGNQLRIPGVRWVYPTAPTRPISCNGGLPMPGWFDIKNLPLDASALDEGGAVSKSDLDRHVDGSGVEESVRYLLDLVRREVEERKIPAEKIVLGGFSQGGHVVARAALECDLPIAGCVVLSSWVGHPAAGGAKRRLPFFVGHGEADPMVPAVLAKKSDDLLRSLGHDVTFRTYAGVG